MKIFLLICFIGLSTVACSQNLVHYNDTASHFSIGIPEGWNYVVNPYAGVKLSAKRIGQAGDTANKARESFNINIIDELSPNLETAYKKLLSVLTGTKNVTLVAHGDMEIAGRPFKWLKETHANGLKKELDMENYDFIAYENGKSYIITCVAPLATFKKFEALFFTVARTFEVAAETIAVKWPEEYHFNIVVNQEAPESRTMQMLPQGQTDATWTISTAITTVKNIKAASIDAVLKIYTDGATRQSPLAKCTVLTTKNEPGKQYALFKIETPSTTNAAAPQAQLFYIIQGKKNLFTCVVAVKKPLLSQAFVDKWGAVFLGSKLVRE